MLIQKIWAENVLKVFRTSIRPAKDSPGQQAIREFTVSWRRKREVNKHLDVLSPRTVARNNFESIYLLTHFKFPKEAAHKKFKIIEAFFIIFLRENFSRASVMTFTKAKVPVRSKFNTRSTMVANCTNKSFPSRNFTPNMTNS